MLIRFLAATAMLFILLVGCGASDPTPTPGGSRGDAGATMSPRATPTPASSFMPAPTPTPASGDSDETTDSQIDPVPRGRIIVHTAKMSLVVDDVAYAVDRAANVAGELGGWVVSSDRSSRHTGTIAIRVPAQSLEEAIRRLEALALDVESRAISSQDVTDDYVDTESRLASLRATEQRLLSFLDKAEDVEDALQVQKELADLQLRIEEAQGRLNYIGETSAYSLIEVTVKLAAVEVAVDPGPDSSVRVGEAKRFRASFAAPTGIDDFSFVWDFGDGSSAAGSGSALRPDGTRVTATVNHVYNDDGDSPYIVTVNLTGRGDGGLAEGSASLLVSVSRVPTIEVFAGDDRTVEEGSRVDYTASFTRHEELSDYEYRWDFGGGSPTVTGKLEEGATRVEIAHAFIDHRPTPYDATLTISAMSDAGRVSGSDSFQVQVTESKGFLIGGWNVLGTLKAAVRALTAIAQVALLGAIWVGVFIPVIAVVGGIIYFVNHNSFIQRYIRRARTATAGAAGVGLDERYRRSAETTDSQETGGSDAPDIEKRE